MKRTDLTGSSFQRLLKAFDPDERSAAEKYERARWRMVKFFTWRGAIDAEALADECLSRAALHIERGVEIRDVDGYLHSFAMLVAKEDERDRQRHTQLPAEIPAPGEEPQAQDAAAACLDRCLQALPVETRTLLLRYYTGSGRAKIDDRRKLAADLGVSENALRNRTLRLREKLERCVANCLKRDVSAFRNTPDEESP